MMSEEENFNESDSSIVPKKLSQLRACRNCYLVKSHSLFQKNGCENCYGNDVNTTQDFEGLIAVVNPEQSWVARYQRINPQSKPGLYAITITK